MNIKFKVRKLTFLIIPDADRSVVRLRLPNFVLYAAGGAVAVLIFASAGLFELQDRMHNSNDKLQAELSGQAVQYGQTLAVKEVAIEQLQSEIIQLSQQAVDIKQKLDEMKKLENDLRSITNGDKTLSLNMKAANAADGTPAIGLGGEMKPVTEDEMIKLSEETKMAYESIDGQIEQLKASLSSAKQVVLQKQQQIRVTPTIWPTESRTITSGFGYRVDPITRQPSFHSGYDIGAKLNSPAVVTADGTVYSTGFDNSHGNNIIVDHTGGLRTWYMHLNKIMVKKGEAVQKGQTIGLVGSTGRSTGPHLHYEVLLNGRSVDPGPYLK